MVSPWRLHARNVIQAAIKNCSSSDPKAIRKAISEAYPYGQRLNHPYQIWCSEVKSALEELAHKCKWCKDTGCLICKAKKNGH